MAAKLTADEVQAFLAEVFPEMSGRFEVLDAGDNRARIRWLVAEGDLRPGGTVSGPTMFAAADCAFYVAVLAMIGREALTVTASLTINFLRKPTPGHLICEARILKLGRTLATGDMTVWSEGGDAPVAHATTTYAIPGKR